jgi:hypothetical protein
MMKELVCTSCGVIQKLEEAKLSYQRMSTGGAHVRADCCECGAWIKWLPQTPETLTLIKEPLTTREVLDEFAFDFDTVDYASAKEDIKEDETITLDFDTLSLEDTVSGEECPIECDDLVVCSFDLD